MESNKHQPPIESSHPRYAKYPRAIFLIIATEFCERFSFCGLRTILSLYLRNNLRFAESTATIIYHVFIMLCYFGPILGASLADSFLGRFRTIFYFSFVYTSGNMLLSLAAMPTIQLPPMLFTMLGLVLIAFGTGGIKPCVAAFGGDQFRLPQQQILLEQFFSIFYFTINFGGLFGMIITPILRKSVGCFGDETCYALGFGFPAILMFLALIFFISGKPLYRIKFPKENIILQFIKCAMTAICAKIQSKKKNKAHWLDYAEHRYSDKLIADMKSGSRWTFQASRTNGQVFGISIQPDQLPVINPAIVLLLIPLFDKCIYPTLDKFRVLESPLHRIACGGFISSLAFIVTGLLEMKLEASYPVLPGKSQAHINFVNLLPCPIQLVNPFNNLQSIGSGGNFVFQKVRVGDNASSYDFDVISPYECGIKTFVHPRIAIHLIPEERMVSSVLISEANKDLVIHSLNPVTLEASLGGKPKIRVVCLRQKEADKVMRIQFLKRSDNKHHSEILISQSEEVVSSYYLELNPAEYRCLIQIGEQKQIVYADKINLKSGGVYNLIVQEQNRRIVFVKLIEITPPNSVHTLWMVPQYILISIGEVMFAIAGLQFSFTQAPKSMKTVTIAAWYLSVAVGNLFVIIITQLKLFRSQANEFFFFAFLALIDMVVFLMLANRYKLSKPDMNESSSLLLVEDKPILVAPEDSAETLRPK